MEVGLALKTLWLTGMSAMFAGTLFAATSPAPDTARETKSLNAVCAHCHTLQIVTDTPRSFEEWHDTVQAMVDRGAGGTDEQFDDVMDYLHRTLTTINVNAADVGELEIVLSVPKTVAEAIVARRATQRFTDLADLKSVIGIDAAVVDAKARLIFFK